jgi:hypothetical protein
MVALKFLDREESSLFIRNMLTPRVSMEINQLAFRVFFLST